jgi:hypothetical protein
MAMTSEPANTARKRRTPSKLDDAVLSLVRLLARQAVREAIASGTKENPSDGQDQDPAG